MEVLKNLKELLKMKLEKTDKNKPVRLNKTEPLEVEYNEATVYRTGAIFITLLVILAFNIGTDSFNYLLGSVI